MKINRLTSVPAPARRGDRDRGRAGGSGAFAKALSSGEGAAAAVGGATLARVDALLALQEASGGDGEEERARRRGEDLLQRLEDIRLSLLSGRLSIDVIERLAGGVASQRGRVDDPRLAQVLDEIELRAAVELAKLGR